MAQGLLPSCAPADGTYSGCPDMRKEFGTSSWQLGRKATSILHL